MNDKALVPLEPRDLTELKGVAQLFAASGLFNDTKDMAQAFVKIMAGREAGFGAFASMQNVHIISGKPVLSAHMMAAAVKRNPKYDYQIVELTDKVCVLEFYQDGKVAGIVRQTIEDARTAKVTSNTTWEKYPRNMLFARAISNGVRWYCPDAFDMPVYTPDELGAEDDSQVPYDNETGEVIEGAFTEDEPEPEPPPAPPAESGLDEWFGPSQPSAGKPQPPAPRKPRKGKGSADAEPPPENPIEERAKVIANKTCPWDGAMRRQPWQDFIQMYPEWNTKFWPAVKALGMDNDMAHEALGVESMKDWKGTDDKNTIAHLWYALTLAAVESELVDDKAA
jgi:hypothetical protein